MKSLLLTFAICVGQLIFLSFLVGGVLLLVAGWLLLLR